MEAGNRVIIASRTQKTGQATSKELLELNKGDAKFMKLDLADQQSVRSFAQSYIDDELPLDVLILNAGVSETVLQHAEGVELTIATNHLGHFLLTQLLRPIMKPGGRVVIVSSSLHNTDARGGPNLDLEDLDCHKNPDDYNGQTQYRNSKLLNVLFFKQLTKELKDSGITVACMNPGWIRQTNLARNYGFFTNVLATTVSFFMPKTVVRTVEQGADVIVSLAIGPQYIEQTGVYYDCLLNPKNVNPIAESEQLQLDAWNVSCDLVKLPENKIRK